MRIWLCVLNCINLGLWQHLTIFEASIIKIRSTLLPYFDAFISKLMWVDEMEDTIQFCSVIGSTLWTCELLYIQNYELSRMIWISWRFIAREYEGTSEAAKIFANWNKKSVFHEVHPSFILRRLILMFWIFVLNLPSWSILGSMLRCLEPVAEN